MNAFQYAVACYFAQLTTQASLRTLTYGEYCTWRRLREDVRRYQRLHTRAAEMTGKDGERRTEPLNLEVE